MKVIVTNDDFAVTFGFTEAIKQTFLKGITTSTSIEVNGPAFDYSVQLLKTSMRNIGLNLHLNLNHGKGYAEELLDKNGNYKYSIFHYYLLFQRPSKKILQAINKDLEHQIQIALKNGLNLTGINGHNHIHLVPPIFEITCKLCKKYGINYTRLPKEPFYLAKSVNNLYAAIINKNFARFLLVNYFSGINLSTLNQYKLKSAQAFYGVLYTNYMDTKTLQTSLAHALKKGYDNIEILGHPAYKDSRDKEFTCNFMAKYSESKERRIEAKAFQSQELKKFIKNNNIQLITMKNL